MRYLLTFLKGMAMGAADVIPGVSGGTIAFIAGIYEELIESIRSIGWDAVQKLYKEGFRSFWSHIHGSFLLSLFTGIAVSITSLAKLITYLLEYHPVLLWSFFFGLILASVVYIAREIQQWRSRVIVAMAAGSAIAYSITVVTPSHSPEGLSFLFGYGFIAIIAMILPGISGAFILLLLGAYGPIISTLNEFRIGVSTMEMDLVLSQGIRILSFSLGCICGLMAFSRLLSWLFRHYRNTALALLTGFMVGSLNKIWPWKETLSARISHEGSANQSVIPFVQQNVWPWKFTGLNEVEQGLSVVPSKDPHIVLALMLMVCGIGIIAILHKYAPVNE